MLKLHPMCSLGISTNAKKRKSKPRLCVDHEFVKINLLPCPSSAEVVDLPCKTTDQNYFLHTP